MMIMMMMAPSFGIENCWVVEEGDGIGIAGSSLGGILNKLHIQ